LPNVKPIAVVALCGGGHCHTWHPAFGGPLAALSRTNAIPASAVRSAGWRHARGPEAAPSGSSPRPWPGRDALRIARGARPQVQHATAP